MGELALKATLLQAIHTPGMLIDLHVDWRVCGQCILGLDLCILIEVCICHVLCRHI